MKRINTKPKIMTVKKPDLKLPPMPKVKGIVNPLRLLK